MRASVCERALAGVALLSSVSALLCVQNNFCKHYVNAQIKVQSTLDSQEASLNPNPDRRALNAKAATATVSKKQISEGQPLEGAA